MHPWASRSRKDHIYEGLPGLNANLFCTQTCRVGGMSGPEATFIADSLNALIGTDSKGDASNPKDSNRPQWAPIVPNLSLKGPCLDFGESSLGQLPNH